MYFNIYTNSMINMGINALFLRYGAFDITLLHCKCVVNYFRIFFLVNFHPNEWSNQWKNEWANSHTPRSNIAWECLYTTNGNSKHLWRAIGQKTNFIWVAKVQKGYELLFKKIKSAFPLKNAYLHIMSFITTKFHVILFSGFSGVVLTNCFSSIFHFGQIFKFKKGVIPRKKIE